MFFFAVGVSIKKFAGPEQRFCPAGTFFSFSSALFLLLFFFPLFELPVSLTKRQHDGSFYQFKCPLQALIMSWCFSVCVLFRCVWVHRAGRRNRRAQAGHQRSGKVSLYINNSLYTCSFFHCVLVVRTNVSLHIPNLHFFASFFFRT